MYLGTKSKYTARIAYLGFKRVPFIQSQWTHFRHSCTHKFISHGKYLDLHALPLLRSYVFPPIKLYMHVRH